MSGGKSKSKSQQVSQGSTFVDPTQVPFLSALRTAGTRIAAGQLERVGDVAGELSGQLLEQGQQFLGQLGELAGDPAGGFQDAIGKLLSFGGADTAQPGTAGQALISAGGAAGLQGADLIRGAAGSAAGLLGVNPALGGQISSLQAAIQQNLAATTGTIASQASLVGGAQGGSRQALATGLAAQGAQQAFGAGAADLVAQEFAGRQALAPQLVGQQLQAGALLQQGGLAQAGQAIQAGTALQAGQLGGQAQQIQQQGQQIGALQAAGQLQLGLAGQQAGAAQAGLAGLGGQFNLGLAPFSAEFGPILSLAQIIGAPTVIGAQTASGTSKSSAFQLGSPS